MGRRFFIHGKISGGMGLIVFWLVFKFSVLLYIGSFLLGYIVHLLLDSTTKMGLPSGNTSVNLIKNKKLIEK